MTDNVIEIDREEFSKELKRWRLRDGKRQYEICQDIEIEESTLCIIKRKGTMSMSTYKKLKNIGFPIERFIK